MTVVGGLSTLVAANRADAAVNSARYYPLNISNTVLDCTIQTGSDRGAINRHLFGTNLEWFNEGGGFASPDLALRSKLVDLARQQRVSVMRYPGGTLADYYYWRDGIGPVANRPIRKHPTDPGSSSNVFGSPEFFALLRDTNSEGLITVNVGTSTASVAADWVRYCNAASNEERTADGFPNPIGIKLWEIGNEVYLPGNPGDQVITQTPEQYAANFTAYAKAMRQADPSITLIGIGTADAHVGPSSQYPNWTETLLCSPAVSDMDMIAVHNSYFPLLYNETQPDVQRVYPALWAAPEAVAASLTKLSALIQRYEKNRPISIGVTEWGALFSMPNLDPYWTDHVKTQGTGVYVARLLQVFMNEPRMSLANYFKFSDRSFMGWVGFDGQPKVPYWVFRLFAESNGDRRLTATINSPTYSTDTVAVMTAQTGVPDVTAVATKNSANGEIYVSLVNRSMTTSYPIRMNFNGLSGQATAYIRSVEAPEPTSHNGVDMPPEVPWKPEYEPYTSAKPGSISIIDRSWTPGTPILLNPFSVAVVVVKPGG